MKYSDKMLSLINDHLTTDNASYGIIIVDKDVARLKIEPHHDGVAQSVTLQAGKGIKHYF